MADRIGGNSGSSRLFNSHPVTETNSTQPFGPTNNAPIPTATDGFGAVNGGGGSDRLETEELYYALNGASRRVRNGSVEVGRYGKTTEFSYNGKSTYDSNSGSTQWSNRVDSKGNTNRAIEGLGTQRGRRTDTSNDSSLKLGGFWIRDRNLGVQAKLNGNVQNQYGSASGSARVYSEVGVKQMAGYSFTKTGITANAMAEARVIAAGAEASGKISSNSVNIAGQKININADVFGRATVEANAGVGGEVAFDRNPPKAVLTGRVGAFAGAKAYGRARFGIGDVLKVGVYGEGWAGAGAEASGTLGYQDGKFSIGGAVGAGLGLGGKVGLRVDVDVKAAAALAKHVADQDRDGKLTLNDGAAAITNTADAVTSGIDKGATKAMNAMDADGDNRFTRKDISLHASRLQRSLQNALDTNKDGKLGLDDAANAARNLGQGIQQGAEAVGRGVEATGRAIGRGAEAIGNAAHNLVDVNNDGKIGLDDAANAARAVGRGLKVGAEVVGRGLKVGAEATGRAIGRGAEAIGNAAHNLADVNNDGKIGLDDAANAARNIGRAAQNLADVNGDGKIGLADVGRAARNLGRGVQAGANAIGQAAHNLADADGDGKIGLSDVSAAASNIGESVSNTARVVGRGAATAGRVIGNAAKSLGSQASRAADTLAEGASRTFKRASATVSRVASFFGW